MTDYHCDSCAYCESTNDFFTRWCSYWNKVTFLTSGCSRRTDVLDANYSATIQVRPSKNETIRIGMSTGKIYKGDARPDDGECCVNVNNRMLANEKYMDMLKKKNQSICSECNRCLARRKWIK